MFILLRQRWFTMSDGHEVFLNQWYDDNVKPRAVLQLAHGMAEHSFRYDELASFLLTKGIFMVANDHRGHGKTGENNGILGFFADENGFERVVEDIKEINDGIHNQYPETPVFIMGHSMGSFIVRRFIQRFHDVVEGVILSGTGGNPGISGKVGKLVAKSQIRKIGNRTESPLLNKLFFGNFNKGFKEAKTEYDWLTRNPQEVQKYIDDPHCGFIATTGFYYDLISGLETIHHHQEVKKINKDLPIFIFSGDHDPVGHNKKGVLKVIQQYKKVGMKNINYTFYKEGRHEMLNELNKDEVMKDIYQWIEKQLENDFNR